MPRTFKELHDQAWTVLELANRVAEQAARQGTEVAGLAAFFIARSSQALQSVRLLEAAGFNGDAMSVLRTIAELEIDFAYITKEETSERIRLFTTFEHMTRAKLAKGIALLYADDGGVDERAMAAVIARRDAAAVDHPNEFRGWSGVSLRDRARAVDREKIYALVHVDCCGASHSGPETLRYASHDDGDRLIPRLAPDKPDGKAVHLGAALLLGLLERVINHCSLEQLKPDFTRIRDSLNDAALRELAEQAKT